jgi:hypothetical protein
MGDREGRAMIWYLIGLIAMFYFGYAVAAMMLVSSREDDAESNEVRLAQDSDRLIHEMIFVDPHDADEVVKALNAGAREIERLTEPCPVHGTEPCVRWFLRRACGHCTEDDLRQWLAEGRALK